MTHSARAHAPLDPWHRAHGARFTPSGGWHLPVAYAGVEGEAHAVRSSCGLVDLSAFAKWRLLGAGVAKVAEALGGNTISHPHVVTILDSGTLLACRLTSEAMLLLDGSTDAGRIPDKLGNLAEAKGVVVAEATFALAGFCLAGPFLDPVLAKLTSLDLARSLPPGSCAETSVAGVQGLLVRAGELIVPSVRVYVAWDLAEYVWGRVLEAGRDRGLAPCGLEAFRALAATS
jgi:glycine cleavage system aminomethyltransferase T